MLLQHHVSPHQILSQLLLLYRPQNQLPSTDYVKDLIQPHITLHCFLNHYPVGQSDLVKALAENEKLKHSNLKAARKLRDGSRSKSFVVLQGPISLFLYSL
jgi:hypothetical protein